MADSAVPVRSAYKSSIIPEINPVPTCCFCLKSFLWKGPQTIKIKKNDQILGYISFNFEICANLGHFFA